MAVNSNPLIQPGQNIPPELLNRLLALRGDFQPGNQMQQWYDPSQGEWAPVVSYQPGFSFQGTGNGGDNQYNPSLSRTYISQPRNQSTWGGNDAADVWDDQGNYLGTSSGPTDLRSLARVAAAGAAGYFGGGYLNGAEGAAAGSMPEALGSAGGYGFTSAEAPGALTQLGGATGSAGSVAGGSAAGATGAAGSVAGAAGGAGGGMSFDWGNWIGPAANLAGAVIQSRAAGNAADQQAQAADRATQLRKDIYDQQTALNRPFVQGGTAAFNALLDRLGLTGNTGAEGFGDLGRVQTFDPGSAFHAPTAEEVMAQPGYQFGLQQGQSALDRQAAARGTRYSGAALAQAARYGNDYATGQYGAAYDRAFRGNQQDFANRLNAFNTNQGARQDVYNRFSNVAGMGQNAANQQGTNGNTFATAAGNNLMSAADAGAANSIAQGNIWGNALNRGISDLRNATQGRSSYQPVNTSSFRWDDPYRNPGYFGGDVGE